MEEFAHFFHARFAKEHGQQRGGIQNGGLHLRFSFSRSARRSSRCSCTTDFSPGFSLKMPQKESNVFAGDGLEDDAVAFLHEVDARAGLDAEPAADARGHDQLAFGGDVGGIHIFSVILMTFCHAETCKAS